MRAAPPVDYPVSRRGLWDLSASALAGAAAGVPAGWLAWQLETARMIGDPVACASLACTVVLTAFFAVWAWRRCALADERSVRWDGQAWHEVDAAGRATELGSPKVCVDLGGAVLLHAPCHGSRVARWLPLQRQSAPARWHALRVALRGAGAGPAPRTSAAIEGAAR